MYLVNLEVISLYPTISSLERGWAGNEISERGIRDSSRARSL
jgi:hypothetical protein